MAQPNFPEPFDITTQIALLFPYGPTLEQSVRFNVNRAVLRRLTLYFDGHSEYSFDHPLADPDIFMKLFNRRVQEQAFEMRLVDSKKIIYFIRTFHMFKLEEQLMMDLEANLNNRNIMEALETVNAFGYQPLKRKLCKMIAGMIEQGVKLDFEFVDRDSLVSDGHRSALQR